MVISMGLSEFDQNLLGEQVFRELNAMAITPEAQARLETLREQVRRAEARLTEFGFDTRRGIETYSTGELQRLIGQSKNPGEARSIMQQVIDLQEELYRQLYLAAGMKSIDVDTDTPEKSLTLVKRALAPRGIAHKTEGKFELALEHLIAALQSGGSEKDRVEAVVTAIDELYQRDYDKNRVLGQILEEVGIGKPSDAPGSVTFLASLLVKHIDQARLAKLKAKSGRAKK